MLHLDLSTLPKRKLTLCFTTALVLLALVFACNALKTRLLLWGDIGWSSLVERRNCIILRKEETNNHLRKVLYQCAENAQKCYLMMITKEGHLRIDPTELISGHGGRPYHRLIEVVETRYDDHSEVEGLPVDWQTVYMRMDQTSGCLLNWGGKVTSFPDLQTAAVHSLSLTETKHTKTLWVLIAPIEYQCGNVLLTWGLLQQKGLPVWIIWENGVNAPR